MPILILEENEDEDDYPSLDEVSIEFKARYDELEPFYDALEKKWDDIQDLVLFDGKIAEVRVKEQIG